jgi:class 3 adenylate cyclase
LGRIGYEGRFDYAAIGSVTNLAARLCSESEPWQVLMTQRVHAAVGDAIVGESVGLLHLRGFSRPVKAFAVQELDVARVAP